MLTARCKAKRVGSVWGEPQNPGRQPLCVKQFTRLSVFLVWIAPVLLVKAPDSRLEFLRIFQFHCPDVDASLPRPHRGRLEPLGKRREEFVPPIRDKGRKAERAGASESAPG